MVVSEDPSPIHLFVINESRIWLGHVTLPFNYSLVIDYRRIICAKL